jgi:hypothetical protein
MKQTATHGSSAEQKIVASRPANSWPCPTVRSERRYRPANRKHYHDKPSLQGRSPDRSARLTKRRRGHSTLLTEPSGPTRVTVHLLIYLIVHSSGICLGDDQPNRNPLFLCMNPADGWVRPDDMDESSSDVSESGLRPTFVVHQSKRS